MMVLGRLRRWIDSKMHGYFRRQAVEVFGEMFATIREHRRYLESKFGALPVVYEPVVMQCIDIVSHDGKSIQFSVKKYLPLKVNGIHHLKKISEQGKCVICPGHKGFEKPKPAAYVFNMQASKVLDMIESGLFVHYKENSNE